MKYARTDMPPDSDRPFARSSTRFAIRSIMKIRLNPMTCAVSARIRD